MADCMGLTNIKPYSSALFVQQLLLYRNYVSVLKVIRGESWRCKMDVVISCTTLDFRVEEEQMQYTSQL